MDNEKGSAMVVNAELPTSWNTDRLENIALIQRGRFSPRPRNDPQYFGGDIPFVQTGDITNAKIYISNYKQTLNTKGLAVSKLFSKDTILMTIAANIGDVAILAFDSACTDSLVAFKPKSNIYNKWLFYELCKLKRFFVSIATQNAQKNLSIEKLKFVKINIPPLPEQKAIANILSTWDTAIEKTEALIAAKEERFKWLVKQLIIDNGQLKGNGWQKFKLGEIGEISSAGVDKKIVKGEEEVVLLNYLDVYRRNKIYSNELNHRVTAPKRKVQNCSIKKGDIFFTPSSEVRDDIASSAVAMEDIKGGVYSYHIIRLRPMIKIDLIYSAYAFTTHSFFKQASKFADGSGQRYVISQDNFRSIYIFLPPLKEQKRIANILNTARREIELLQKLAEQYKLQKKGLMQKLLTGKWRATSTLE